ncbi:hypothetical protein G3570_13920 [Balneolaceae bacterium YR4-1]|uniref:Uncharacterized protein n=1 Tax=Halalkalibaculum roseum TaxID=2709311 RepID=A0A6M1SXF4_9BACT|nr:hypothetical protein [Halalkalibaculum roseum]NGP77740.1 hypothetical protein [Halalkalibaculum roseum]
MKWAFLKNYKLLLPIALGLVALSIPLLRDFHIESALLAAFIGCFWAGWKASKKSSNGNDISQALSILGYLYLFGLPLLVYTILAGCFSLHGLYFWVLFPIPSVFFGTAVGRLFRILNIPYGRMVTVLVLLGVSFGALILEFYSYPQVYFFNHVWGGWPGPIYDETVQVTGSLLNFRLLTLMWICLLWSIPHTRSSSIAKVFVTVLISAIALFYLYLPQLGIISPETYIQKQLGGQRESDHFTLYYDEGSYTVDEIDLLVKEHEFYYNQISQKLELSPKNENHRIESYLYAHPWQKKKLTGAKFTSYVPVWLEQDQLHIAKQQLSGSLKHEMVHVLAKQFGNRLLNASWSIGLIEGLAVAVAPDESTNSTIDQIVASEKPLPDADQMEHSLSPLGFYGGRSTVNYTTSGSFVRYLLDDYPVSNFKQAYRSSDFSDAYRQPFSELVRGWHNHLDTVSVDSVDQRIARRLFSIPSLFEKDCPHIVSDFAAHWDDYQYHLADGDTAKAVNSLDEAFILKPDNLFIKTEWTFRNLQQGNPERVQQRAAIEDTLVDLQLLYADAFRLTGDHTEAGKYLSGGVKLFEEDPEPDSLLIAAIETRSDSLQWSYYLDLRYENKLVQENMYPDLLYRTKILTMSQVAEKEQWSKFIAYSRLLSEFPLNTRYFDRYLYMLHLLGYLQEWELAELWLSKLEAMDHRKRFEERFHQQKEWITFLKQSEASG